MKIPNEDFENLSRNSKNQKGLFQLLEEKSENIVKKQYNQNELFFAEHYLKDYVNNLKKQTIIGLDDEIKKNLFIKPKKHEHSNIENKNVRGNRRKFRTVKKQNKIIHFHNRRLSDNVKTRIKLENIHNEKPKKKLNKVINLRNRRLSDNIKTKTRMNLENVEYDIEKVKRKQLIMKDENRKNNKYNIILNKKDNFKSMSYRKSFELDKHSITKNKSSNILSKRNLLEKSLLDEEINFKRHSFFNNKNLGILNKPTIFNGENDSKSIIYDNGNKNNIIKTTHMNNKEIVQLNEIKNDMKDTIIGKSTIIEIDPSKLFLIDENGEIKEKKINKIEDEKYRILTRKGYVYDSFDDEENIDEVKNFIYIHPNSIILKIIDFLVFIFTFYNLFYIPLFLGMSDIYCKINEGFNFNSLLINFTDITFIFDVIISFFIAYYNFEEILVTEYSLMIEHYLETWFIIDFITAIPFQTLFTLFNKKCKDKDYFLHPFNNKEFYYLFILLRLLKIFKIISKNQFLQKMLRVLAKLKYLNGRVLINIFTFFFSLHIVVCIFIFIGKNDYPNWIVNFNHSNKSFKELYLIAIYYTITTLTTVGYGDISCISPNEKIFGLFMEVIGICAYSWALTEISNYIKVLNDKTEELSKKIQILDDIKLNYPYLTEELYDRIIRYLKYKHINEKRNIQSIFDELPIGLRNSLIYEMYKPVINNFTFFKDFPNTDFIVKVIAAFKPIIALKNDILIKNGDLVEEIIFVKKGSLSLEIPFTFQKKSKRRSTRNSKLMRRSALFYNNNARINPLDNNNIFTINEEKKPMKTSFTFINALHKYDNDEREKIQYFQILKIRRNEHFGDILMLLDQRSPLLLRVKSKKAELFFLNKEDAINISTSYPQYWKKINKKSLFNLKQIQRLVNKIIKIISAEHGLNPIFKNIKINDELKNFEKIQEVDLKSIPSFSQESNIYNSINIENNNNEIEDDENENNGNNLLENKNKKFNKNRLSLNTIFEDENNSPQLNNRNSSSSSSEINIKTNKQKNINNNIKIKEDIEYIKNKIYNKYSTPYDYDEINNEIYPEENFIISPQNQCFKFKTNYIQNSNLDNFSICSTEISFSINSEYENIDKLSEYNYSKDISFRKSINNYIKKEVNKKKKNIFKINIINENNDNLYNSNISKKKSFASKTNSIKSNSINPFKSPRKSNVSERNSIKDLSNRKLLNIENDKKNDNENKDDILSVISQNIENDNMNLNNPDLFYSGIFMKFMDKKMTHKEEDNNNNEINNEEIEFIRKISSIRGNK